MNLATLVQEVKKNVILHKRHRPFAFHWRSEVLVLLRWLQVLLVLGIALTLGFGIWQLNRGNSWRERLVQLDRLKEAKVHPEEPALDAPAAPLRNVFIPPLIERTSPKSDARNEELKANYRLVAVLIGNGTEAVVEERKTESTHYLKEGDTLEGYAVIKIEKGKMTLKGNDGQVELTL